jgi:choline dehydrogenase-like flavoprotein
VINYLALYDYCTDFCGNILAENKNFTVIATNEVILSAGAIGTVQILKLSGIGPGAELAALGIPLAIDNENVGENLSDHTLLPNIFNVQGNLSFDNIIRNPTATLNQWISNQTGVFANNVANNFGFLRLPSNATIFKNTTDPAAGPNSPHWEIIFAVSPHSDTP